ncbi:MAG: DUF1501 domain-containing protein [Pirellulaceae bacterium]|nr:DUF1501 domain-containing protein [Pirellulaceae bacterium]
MLRTFANVTTSAHGIASRRGFLKTLSVAAGAGAVSLSWRDLLLAKSDELKKSGKKMILLWMDGGPSQFETFNPKIGSQFQGPAKAINTKLPGVQVAEYWPKTAQVMDKIALIRSMVSQERDHFRAIKLVRTGYPMKPTIPYPTWGSVVARDRYDPGFDLPAFVRIGKPRIKTRDVNSGVLGPRYESFKIDEAGKLPDDVHPTVDPAILQRRLALAAKLDGEFAARGSAKAAREQQEIYNRTSRFVLSPLLSAFDLSKEPDSLRDAYGRNYFGQGCLLARRLIEAGVSFIEVINGGTINDQGWDTHKNGFAEMPILADETDSGYAMLLTDLADRGLLDDTLVVWMGEFCRTPKFDAQGGRDHYSDGWQVGFSGGGVKMGQVIGSTDDEGVKVKDRPVEVSDLFVTFCQVLGLDPHSEYYTELNQPLKLVEGGTVIKELF